MRPDAPLDGRPFDRTGGWLANEALVVVEEATAARFVAPEGFVEIERRAYDDTEFVILRMQG